MRLNAFIIFIQLFYGNALFASPNTIQFRLPIKCELNKTCWIARYMNLGTPENPKDYNGGRLTDTNHNGVDFALQDLKQLNDGVEVLAAADGVVIDVRADQIDEAITAQTRWKVAGIECGNGVTIDHGNDLKTRYCHMKHQSLRVKVGEKVKAGQPLGLVGLSGLSEYPHLHLTTIYQGKKIDPFMGIPPSNKENPPKPHPLWDEATMALMPYGGGKIYNMAVTSEEPDLHKLRAGQYRSQGPLTNPLKLAGSIELFALSQGDKVTINLLDPTHKEIFKKSVTIPKYEARAFIYAGLKKPAEGWKTGSWQLRIDYESANGKDKHSRVVEFTIQ